MEVLDAPELLRKDELREATGKCRPAQQAEWLAQRGIPHQVDGRRIIVSRSHFRDWLQGKVVPRTSGINWGAVS